MLLCVPPLSSGVFVGYALLLVRVVYPVRGDLAVHDPMNVALFLSMVGVFFLAAVAGDEGLLATPTSANWLAIVAVMVCCAGVAVVGVVRGWRAGNAAARNSP